MIELEIDGKKTTVEEGTSIIEAADELGIYIPRFCYHKKLSIAANCRMCLVEVEKVGKPLPACATPVTPGMKVFTSAKKAVDAQTAVMEFLLINHPLDCPICDQGGECELQDLAMGFGRPFSSYDESKRAVFSENIGPLVETEMTRCIQCTRCVRFGEEIAGLRELGVINRGEKEEISTYVKHFMRSELSGNIIDICPVGALTDKPARYKGRGWEYREHPFISPHDCVGSNLFLHSRWEEYAPQRKVMRAVPRENDAINETWISDRDRFSHFGLYHETRLYKPRVKKNNHWLEVEWEEALKEVASRTKILINQHGADSLGAIASPNSTIEELYLFQKLIRQLGSPNVDHRIRWQDFRDQHYFNAFPGVEIPIADIEKLNAALLIGSNVRAEQPMISHRLNQAFLDGAAVMAINPVDYSFIFDVSEKIIASPQGLTSVLAQVAKALAGSDGANHPLLRDATVSEAAKKIAAALKLAEKTAVFLGEHALHHAHAAEIRALAQLIAQYAGARVGLLTEGANSAGAWLAGFIPHRGPAATPLDREGLDVKSMLTTDAQKAYFLLNVEPEFDCADASASLRALDQAEFVICLTPFVTESMKTYADVLLPVTPFTEAGGTYVNAEGRWQSFSPVSVPESESQPAWKVLRVLGNFFECEGFDYETVHNVHHEIKKRVDGMAFTSSSYSPEALGKNHSGLLRVAPWPMYRVDNLVRRSKPLQEVASENLTGVRVNAVTARNHQLKENDRVTVKQNSDCIVLSLVVDDRVADNTVLLAAGLAETAGFGKAEAEVILERVD